MSKRTVLFKKKVRQTAGTPEAVARLIPPTMKPEKAERLLRAAGVGK